MTKPADAAPMRVMFLNSSMPVGGAEMLLVNLVRRMDRRRFSPEVCCLKEPGELGERIAAELPLHSGLISHKFDVGVLGRLNRLFRERKMDAIVTVGAGDKMFWGRLAARRAGVPVVLSALHSTGWPDGVGRLNRWLTGITDGFIAVAKNHGQFLVDFEKFPQNKVFVIPNGVDVERFCAQPAAGLSWRRQWGIPESAPVVGIVAALRPEKNHAMFVESARRTLADLPDAHFLIVGDGPEKEAIKTLVQEKQLDQRVHLTGGTQEIPAALSAMDLFSLTSHNEASPVSILEAMACELPIAATDVGSVRESVIDGQTGWVVPAGDVAEMSRTWVAALSDRDRARRVGACGRRHVVEHASLEVMVRGYEDLLEQVWQSKRRKTSRRRQRADRRSGQQRGVRFLAQFVKAKPAVAPHFGIAAAQPSAPFPFLAAFAGLARGRNSKS